MEDAAFGRTLDAIYEAATRFDRWPVALELMGEAFGCGYVGLIDRNLRTMEGRAVAIGVDAAGQREYFEVWSKTDALRMRTSVFRAGAVETDRDILPRSELLRSDYYNGFMKPHDMHAYLRMTLSIENGFRKIISMCRPVSLGDFEADHIEQCRRLMPHLQRAARVTRQVDESSLLLTGFSDVLEQSTTGVLLVDRTGSVVFANRAARAMAEMADGFTLRRERIAAPGSKHDVALQRLIAGATGRAGHTDSARGGVIRLPRKSGKRDLAITAAPLPSGPSWDDTGPVAFVLITDPDVTAMRPKAMMQEMFGLSAAETSVAERLVMGDSPEQAAAILEVKTSTVRWHLASLYRKTGTSRQAELVRLLLSLPTI